MSEETMTVNGSDVHWGGGSGKGNSGGACNDDGVSSNGPVVSYGLDGKVRINIYGANPICPLVSGAPWGSDKNAASIISANLNRKSRFKANIYNWHAGYGNTGSLDSPAINDLSGWGGEMLYFQVSFGKENYNVYYNTKKDIFETSYASGYAGNAESRMDEQAIAVVKLYLLEQKQKDILNTAAGIITDSGKTLGKKIGDKYNTLAKEAANNIKNFQGNKLRSFKDTMAAVNELANNPRMKLSQADKTAVSNALKQINLATLADRFKGLGKAFTWGDRLLKAEKIRDGIATGIATGNYQKLAFEVEAMCLSGVAGSVALGIVTAMISAAAVALSLPSVAVTALTVVAVIGIAILTSYIDADKAKSLNNAVLGLFK